MVNTNRKNLFVYGTLMSGFGNNHLLQGKSFIKATLIGNYSLYSLGFCPALVKDNSKNSVIKGELYFDLEARDIDRIDVLEGYVEGRESNFYTRIVDTVVGKDNIGYESSLYIVKDLDINSFNRIEYNDWRTYFNLNVKDIYNRYYI